jgi:uncharacterized protein (DUF697 family)
VNASIDGIGVNMRSTLATLYGIDVTEFLAKGMVKGNIAEQKANLIKSFEQKGIASFRDR